MHVSAQQLQHLLVGITIDPQNIPEENSKPDCNAGQLQHLLAGITTTLNLSHTRVVLSLIGCRSASKLAIRYFVINNLQAKRGTDKVPFFELK